MKKADKPFEGFGWKDIEQEANEWKQKKARQEQRNKELRRKMYPIIMAIHRKYSDDGLTLNMSNS